MSIEEIMSQSPTPRTHSIWNSLVNAGSNPVETGRILGAARKMELELKAANERIKRLEEALDLVRPHCDSVHHSKKHQHQYGEPCPVVALIEKSKEDKL